MDHHQILHNNFFIILKGNKDSRKDGCKAHTNSEYHSVYSLKRKRNNTLIRHYYVGQSDAKSEYCYYGRGCLVVYFEQQLSAFKQYYTYFYILFHSLVFKKKKKLKNSYLNTRWVIKVSKILCLYFKALNKKLIDNINKISQISFFRILLPNVDKGQNNRFPNKERIKEKVRPNNEFFQSTTK